MQNNVDVIIAMLLRGREFKMPGKAKKERDAQENGSDCRFIIQKMEMHLWPLRYSR